MIPDASIFDPVFQIKLDESGNFTIPSSDTYMAALSSCRIVELNQICIALGAKASGRKSDIIKKIDTLIQNSDTNIAGNGILSLCFNIRALMLAYLGQAKKLLPKDRQIIPEFKDLKLLILALRHTAPIKVIIFLAIINSSIDSFEFPFETVNSFNDLEFLEQAKIHLLRLFQNSYFSNRSREIPRYQSVYENNESFLFSKLDSLQHIYSGGPPPASENREPLPMLNIDSTVNLHTYRNVNASLTVADMRLLQQHRRGLQHDHLNLANLVHNNSYSYTPPRPVPKKAPSGLSSDTVRMMDEYKFIQSYFFVNTRLLKQGILPKTGYKTTTMIKFKLSEADVQRLYNNSPGKGYGYDVLLYCGPFTNTIQPREFVKFPSPIEVKINNVHITDYIRGIKDKPETAQAARLTEHLIMETEKENTIQITFIRTATPFICKVYLVKSYDGMQLFKKSISIKEHIPKLVTINKVKEILQEDDEELQMETMKMSLQCPISYMRMKNPVRSITCRHIQCFDAQWFLEAQKQVPLWECPVCQKKVDIMDLRLCDYTLEILKNCKNDYDDQVEITKDGNYKYIEGVKDESESDEGELLASRSNTAENFTFQTPKKNELEPEVINLISDDEEEQNNAPLLPQLSTAVPSIPVLTTAESEEHVGNVIDDDEEMPSLRNDGRDLTMTLARHHLSPENTSQVTKAGTSNESSAPNTGGLPQKRRASVQQTANDFVDLTSD